MIEAAVERLVRSDAFAARQMHPTVRAPDHILTGREAALGLPVYFSSVAHQYPIRDREAEDEQKQFWHAMSRLKSCASLPQARSRVERRACAGADACRGEANTRDKTGMVGVRGFEPPTPASRTQYSTRLSYTTIAAV